ncbi:hypothetical protein [Agreia sp. Leaf210]|uniref:hypothetical protein n=1 Tax=Agreia sp. Leaf210 TaxID=1735682 RepID=UPI0006FBC4FF|nr:hypothetical protein [Agreia sp. Leaf210]KQM59683.1 hypothetical protein ASE64_10220 [Agreia sp. Leaf210]
MSVARSADYRRMTSAVLRWAAWYTRGIDRQATNDRLDELTSDLYEHVVWAESAGLKPTEVARSIRRRRLRGVLDDLRWRRAQLREARTNDPLTFSLGRNDAVALAIVFAVGLAVVIFGAFTLTRLLSYLGRTGDTAVTTLSGALALSALLSTVGLVALGWKRTRFIGALALVIAQAAVVQFGFSSLLYGSSSVNAYMYNSELWPLPKYALAGALALLFAAATLWWWPSRKPARTRLAEAAHQGDRS